MPSMNAEPVSRYISQEMAMYCIQVPIIVSVWPMKNRRKLRCSKPRRIGCMAERDLTEFLELGLQVFQRGGEGGQALLLLRHDLGRGALDETGVGELASGLGDFAFEAGDFLLQSLALCRLVDLDSEHQPAVADYGDGSVGRGQGTDHAYFGQLGQSLDVRGERFQPGLVAGGEQGDALRRGNVHFAAQVAAG